jgi:hypothetical protein
MEELVTFRKVLEHCKSMGNGKSRIAQWLIESKYTQNQQLTTLSGFYKDTYHSGSHLSQCSPFFVDAVDGFKAEWQYPCSISIPFSQA